MPVFTGFPDDTLTFLQELEAHNNRDWFTEHKDRYERVVRGPALDFITAMGPEMLKISEHFVAIPKKVGGSLMRVNRDVRFSKDKSPYKTNIGIQFRHETGKDVHAPGYYLHIDNVQCFLGVGIWKPDSPALQKIRARIDEYPKQLKAAMNGRGFKSQFELGGESLKRPPRGYNADHPNIDDLKRKDFIAVTNLSPDRIHHAGFVREVGGTFRKATDYMAFLCRAMEVNF